MEDEVKDRKPMIDDLFTPLSKRYRPTDTDRQRVLGKIRARIAAADAVAPATTAPAGTRWLHRREPSPRSIRRMGWIGSGVLVLAGIGLTISLRHDAVTTQAPAPAPMAEPSENVGTPLPRPVPLNDPAPSNGNDVGSSVDVGALPSAALGAEPPSASSSKAPRAPSAMPSQDDALERETRLWRKANHALNDGQWVESLRLLDQHAREFPRGVLADERAVERIVVLCHMGHDEQAAREAAAFLATHPRSLLRGRVESTCGKSTGAPSSTSPAATAPEETP
jgi:hypothetical protein